MANIRMNKERTLKEYRNGTAKDGRFYDSTGNSWYPDSDGQERALNKLLKDNFKSYSVDKNGRIKGHEDNSGSHKSSSDAWDAWDEWRNETRYNDKKLAKYGVVPRHTAGNQSTSAAKAVGHDLRPSKPSVAAGQGVSESARTTAAPSGYKTPTNAPANSTASAAATAQGSNG